MNEPTILVTGAAGFIGARLVELLRARGKIAVCVDRPEYFEQRLELARVPFGPIVDRDRLFDWLEEEERSLEAIFHLGACTDTTERDEELFDRVNLEYSKQLWEFTSRRSIPLIYASSAATYGAGEHGYDDDEELIPQLKPLNPYGDSKQQFDLFALSREREGVAPPSWSGFKFFNVYGYGERHKGEMASVVLKATDQIRARGSVRLFRSHHPDYADGGQSRDFVWVDDVVRALLFAWEKPISRGIFNIGTGRARTFLDLARAVFAGLRVPESIEFIDTPPSIRDQYQYFTQAEVKRLREEGFPCDFSSLEDGVRRYVERLLEESSRAEELEKQASSEES